MQDAAGDYIIAPNPPPDSLLHRTQGQIKTLPRLAVPAHPIALIIVAMTTTASQPLTIYDHSRDSNMTYIYPVVSRRAKGVSIGINLNINNACNWGCIYCQVPDLQRGGPPPVDLALLEHELSGFLDHVLHGSFMQDRVPEDSRRLMDIAFSGNGESTSAPEFAEAVEIVLKVMGEKGLLPELPLRVITNGSMLHRSRVQAAIRHIGEAGGEIWFKFDRGSDEGMVQVNATHESVQHHLGRLRTCLTLAPTWIQTCWFARDGQAPTTAEEDAWLTIVALVKAEIQGVHLYGLARQAMQPGSDRLSALLPEALQAFAARITNETGVRVNVSP